MRDGWKYIPFESSIQKVKYTTKVPSSDYLFEGDYPIVSQEEGLISGYWNNSDDVFHHDKSVVIFGDHTRIIKYVDFDFVLGADGVKILLPIEGLSARFLFYYLQWLKVPSLGYSRHYKLLKETTVPIPPTSEQQRIVADLDLLQGVIDKQKAQLKELDTLAHSIFYDMFGDSVTNDKGWDVKTMGEVGELQRGSGLSKKDLVEKGTPCILYGQIHTRFGAFTKKHVACIPNDLVKTAKIAHPGDLIMAITSEDVEGSCKSTAWLGDYDVAVGSDAAIYRHSQNDIYVSFYTQTKAFFNEKSKYARGFKVTHISTKDIALIPILLPPLSLQQSFAEKIEAIEQQKANINASIADSQKLFDYTMDKYFG